MSRLMQLHLLIILPFMVGLAGEVFWSIDASPWQSASIDHPFGTDEFGRDMLAVLSLSIVFSGAKGLILGVLALTVGVITAYCMVMLESNIAKQSAVILALIVESVPLLLWIMIMIIVAPLPWLILIIAFSLGTMPLVSRVAAGEMERLRAMPYVEASLLSGASKTQCTARHILPNAIPVLGPVVIQLSGAAAAADGVFGLIGMSNRQNLDIGTLLLRGKEFVLLHPSLLIMAVLAVAALYFYFWFLYKVISVDNNIDRYVRLGI